MFSSNVLALGGYSGVRSMVLLMLLLFVSVHGSREGKICGICTKHAAKKRYNCIRCSEKVCGNCRLGIKGMSHHKCYCSNCIPYVVPTLKKEFEKLKKLRDVCAPILNTLGNNLCKEEQLNTVAEIAKLKNDFINCREINKAAFHKMLAEERENVKKFKQLDPEDRRPEVCEKYYTNNVKRKAEMSRFADENRITYTFPEITEEEYLTKAIDIWSKASGFLTDGIVLVMDNLNFTELDEESKVQFRKTGIISMVKKMRKIKNNPQWLPNGRNFVMRGWNKVIMYFMESNNLTRRLLSLSKRSI